MTAETPLSAVEGEIKAPVSVLIPTRNEERNLPSTLESLRWADQIFVFDSLSTDATVSIAKAHDCDVVQREFDNYSDHKNWAIANLPFRNDWILIVDADEKVSADLSREISSVCASADAHDAYYVARQIWVDGVWLKYAGKYPDYQIRLFRKGRARYEQRLVHEHMVSQGCTGYLREPLVHVDDKGIYRYLDRHNRFAEMEAVEAFISMKSRGGPKNEFAAREWGGRRQLKVFSYRYLIFRPVLVFFYLYIIKLGFLMGRTGFKVCTLRMLYEYMIDLYLQELRDPTSPVFKKYEDYISERCGHSVE